MPRQRTSNLSSRSRDASRHRNRRNQLTNEERQIQRTQCRVGISRSRASQTQQQREAALETARLAARNRRANLTDQQRHNLRSSRRNTSRIDLNRAAFLYDSTIDYSDDSVVSIGLMDVVCEHCGAMKFSGETSGLCCLNGKVKLPLLNPPPEPLHSLLSGETPESRHFLANTQKYNDCFQMTSFGADIVRERGFNPTFKIQGQIHHRIGSLQPLEDAQHKFLQIYFMGNMEEQLDTYRHIFILQFFYKSFNDRIPIQYDERGSANLDIESNIYYFKNNKK